MTADQPLRSGFLDLVALCPRGLKDVLKRERCPENDFQVGYGRSVGFDFNTVFFGIGFRISN
jgi:hypothetical protein